MREAANQPGLGTGKFATRFELPPTPNLAVSNCRLASPARVKASKGYQTPMHGLVGGCTGTAS